MCKPKPGARCAGHTRAALVKAIGKYEAEPTADNLEAVNTRRDQYLETPEGYEQAIPNGEVSIKDTNGEVVRTIPLDNIGDTYPDNNTDIERWAIAEAFKERRVKIVAAYKEHLAAEQEAQQEEALNDPATWEDQEDDEEEDQFGEAQEPVDGEELDEEGYGSISGINPSGFRRDGSHYGTGTAYDEFGVDEEGWTELGINAETGKISDADGYSRRGFNSITRLHRNGSRLDEEGYDINGLDEDGWNKSGWNYNSTINRDTKDEPHPWHKYDSEGYGADGRDMYGYSRVEGTDKNDFLPDGRYYANQNAPEPQCYLNAKGFNKIGLHHETGKRFDPEGRDKDGYDEDWLDKQGRLHPEVAPYRSTASIHTHSAYSDPVAAAGLTERNGWHTSNSRGGKKLVPVLVKTGFRYRKKPMRMMWEVGVVSLRHRKSKQQRKIYTAALHGTEGRTIAFTEPDGLKDFLNALGVVENNPQGEPF